MCDVPGVGWNEQFVYQELQYRSACFAGAAGLDLLHDFHRRVPAPEGGIGCDNNHVEDLAVQLKIDIDRRTTRGRACPRCGGKIIPSHRAVYQSADPNELFPSWQCERCGYEELIARPVKATAKHGAATVEKGATPEKRFSAVSTSSPAGSAAPPETGAAARTVPALKDRKGRALPPDVNRMIAEMNRGARSEE